mmetsp:Transcript_27717/g.60273  ORF Transcript_27717/g.60273 Transcript_27717/m.60273 type:complete len:148 (-) Transcript_27717:310-753(-)
MPHAILRVNNMMGVTVTDFFLSFPEELKARIMAMIMSTSGLAPSERNNHFKLDGRGGGGILIHTLLNWIESSGWTLSRVTETAVSQYSSCATYIFARTPRMAIGGGGGGGGELIGTYMYSANSANVSGWQAPGHMAFQGGHRQGSPG